MAGEFGFETTAEEAAEGIDLSGKLALVTGGASGLGLETARVLAKQGATVVIGVRDRAKGEAALGAIREGSGNDRVSLLEMDLADLASIKTAAASFVSSHDRLDLLINNAGVMACPLSRTKDGFEMQFGTNHLGHFMLTGLLENLLLAAAPARIVNVSSRGHHIAPVDLDDPNYEHREYEKWQAYGHSKTANILHAVALDARLKQHGVRAYALHPGGIETDLGRHLSEADRAALIESIRRSGGDTRFKTIPQGAATTIYAATAPELDGVGGVYLEDCQIAAVDDQSTKGGVRSYAVDPDVAERLREMSERLVASGT